MLAYAIVGSHPDRDLVAKEKSPSMDDSGRTEWSERGVGGVVTAHLKAKAD